MVEAEGVAGPTPELIHSVADNKPATPASGEVVCIIAGSVVGSHLCASTAANNGGEVLESKSASLP